MIRSGRGSWKSLSAKQAKGAQGNGNWFHKRDLYRDSHIWCDPLGHDNNSTKVPEILILCLYNSDGAF